MDSPKSRCIVVYKRKGNNMATKKQRVYIIQKDAFSKTPIEGEETKVGNKMDLNFRIDNSLPIYEFVLGIVEGAVALIFLASSLVTSGSNHIFLAELSSLNNWF